MIILSYITEDYTSLCLNIICNRSFFILKLCQLCSGTSFTQGWKHIYLPHAQTAIYDSKVKLFLKRNIPSTWLWLNAVVWFECENSAIDMIINFLWKIFHKPIILVILTTASFGGFSNFCLYYIWSQTGKSTRYRPTLKSLSTKITCNLLGLSLTNFKMFYFWRSFKCVPCVINVDMFTTQTRLSSLDTKYVQVNFNLRCKEKCQNKHIKPYTVLLLLRG